MICFNKQSTQKHGEWIKVTILVLKVEVLRKIKALRKTHDGNMLPISRQRSDSLKSAYEMTHMCI